MNTVEKSTPIKEYEHCQKTTKHGIKFTQCSKVLTELLYLFCKDISVKEIKIFINDQLDKKKDISMFEKKNNTLSDQSSDVDVE